VKRLARSVSVVVGVVIASVGTASAECAWVLWEEWSSARGSWEPLHRIVAARSTEDACRTLVVQAAKGRAAQLGDNATLRDNSSVISLLDEKPHMRWDYRCLPDTVDPRAPKEK
jgi:hypothetical protein